MDARATQPSAQAQRTHISTTCLVLNHESVCLECPAFVAVSIHNKPTFCRSSALVWPTHYSKNLAQCSGTAMVTVNFIFVFPEISKLFLKDLVCKLKYFTKKKERKV